MKNPFEIKTPEQNSAQDILDLFVDVFSDFGQVKAPGHTFLNGPRGSGKSMMFRYMLPDCQMLKLNCKAKDLDFFSVYVGVKQTNINNTDLIRLDEHASIIFNEHLLSSFVVANVLMSIKNTFGEELNNYSKEFLAFYKDCFYYLMTLSGFQDDILGDIDGKNGVELVVKMITIIERMEHECQFYCKRITLSKDTTILYKGALIDFVDFVEPFILNLKNIEIFPKDKPFFILIDDAGYLNLAQTKILNTWVSYRSTKHICLKISTQLDYKTHLTSNGKRIDDPHDYSEVNISTIYSSSTSKYNDRISEIVQKRLRKYLNLNVDAKSFFPENEEQKRAIEEISTELKNRYEDSSRKHAGPDAVKRYSRPEYIKRLQKEKGSAYHYSYAGFDQLVNISSGIIRHFLAPAQEMFASFISSQPDVTVEYIPDNVQNEVIKRYSDRFLFDQFDDIRRDLGMLEVNADKPEKLFHLIDSLGRLFHMILVSDATDRRVFSVALTDDPDKELYEILDMCEQFGYLHKSSIGNKSGTGRVRLYVLSRILAPHFKLDPTSYSGYKFMSSSVLKIALTDPNKFLRILEKNIGRESETQLDLFNDIVNYN